MDDGFELRGTPEKGEGIFERTTRCPGLTAGSRKRPLRGLSTGTSVRA